MPGFTPNYNWPYPSDTDSPDARVYLKELARQVDATVKAIDVRVAAAEASVAGLASVTAAWPTWVPTLGGGLVVGNGVQTAIYRQTGKTTDYVWELVLGSTSAVGTNPTITLPTTPHAAFVAASFAGVPIGDVYVFDTGTGAWVGLAFCLSGSTVTLTYSSEVGSGSVTGITASAPITFTTGDRLMAYGTYPSL